MTTFIDNAPRRGPVWLVTATAGVVHSLSDMVGLSLLVATLGLVILAGLAGRQTIEQRNDSIMAGRATAGVITTYYEPYHNPQRPGFAFEDPTVLR